MVPRGPKMKAYIYMFTFCTHEASLQSENEHELLTKRTLNEEFAALINDDMIHNTGVASY